MNPRERDPLQTLQNILENLPPSEIEARQDLMALQESLKRSEESRAADRQMLAEYEEAYSKLTAPANRIGVFLGALPDGLALVALGDTEFVSEIDPNLDPTTLQAGVRVRLNEAYAIVGLVTESRGGAVASVAEALEDGRLRLGSGMADAGGRLVERGPALLGAKVAAGDEVRLDSSGRIAIELMPDRKAGDYLFEDVPVLPWEKVGGQEAAIELIRETIERPLLHPELYAKYDQKPIKGILLYGPPGCGKTLLGKATAYNLTQEYSKALGKPVKEHFLAINGPKILNMWLGETERMVRQIFQQAREKATEGNLVFVFIDEAESILRTRSSGRWMNISNTVVPQFCAELDGLVSLDNVVLMLTSNRPDYIDPAILRPGRIDRKVKVGRPDRTAAEQIMAIYLHESIPIDPDLLAKHAGEIDIARKELIEGSIARLWRRDRDTEFLTVSLRNGSSETLYWSDLVSGALLKSIVDRAKGFAIQRAIMHPERETGVLAEDLDRAMEAEYGENEIFPKSDAQEDWLQLLDYESEQVAAVRAKGRKPERGSKAVI